MNFTVCMLQWWNSQSMLNMRLQSLLLTLESSQWDFYKKRFFSYVDQNQAEETFRWTKSRRWRALFFCCLWLEPVLEYLSAVNGPACWRRAEWTGIVVWAWPTVSMDLCAVHTQQKFSNYFRNVQSFHCILLPLHFCVLEAAGTSWGEGSVCPVLCKQSMLWTFVLWGWWGTRVEWLTCNSTKMNSIHISIC